MTNRLKKKLRNRDIHSRQTDRHTCPGNKPNKTVKEQALQRKPAAVENHARKWKACLCSPSGLTHGKTVILPEAIREPMLS